VAARGGRFIIDGACLERGKGPAMTIRMVAQTLLMLAVQAALILLPAGDWRWPEGWAYLGEVGFGALAIGL
jgi:hypothetical protein